MKLIDIINSEIENFLNEDIQTNTHKSNIGRNIYSRIKKNINNIKFEPTDENDVIKDNRGNFHQLYGVKFNLNQIDNKYDLGMYFVHSFANQVGHYDEKNNRIVFFIISQINKNDFEGNQHMARVRFGSWVEESMFVHEFTHYLDSLEYSPTYQFHTKDSETNYYNSPEEFNAYSMELFNKILKNKNKWKELAFPDFYKKVIQHINVGFFENLSNENKKRLTKRLYSLHQNIQ
jgi:hypothetical protein